MFKARNSLPKELHFLIVTVLVAGIVFRFINLDRKDYWNDETYTSLRISGYTSSEVKQRVYTGRQISVEELLQYQSVNPNKSVIDTVKGLAKEEAQLPPLYFVMVRLWTQWFGSSVAVVRSLSAVISLLAFPCLYWLCLELFNSPMVGGVAVMLLAVSPFHVLYAQEARMYSLWSVQVLLTSATFLRAMRLNTKFSWGIYVATVVLGLYTHLLSTLVIIGQGIYLGILEKFKVTKRIFFYLLSLAIAILCFTPWLLAILYYLNGVKSALAWLKTPSRFLERFNEFIEHICESLIDLGFLDKEIYLLDLKIPNLNYDSRLQPILLIFIGYSIYFLFRKTPVKVWLFVSILIFLTPLLLALRDITANSQSLSHARYIVPCYLGIQISLAYLFATQISHISIRGWQKKFWRLAMVLLISGGILSCAISSQALTWSNKYNSNQYQVARVINQYDRPLLIGDVKFIQVLSLSHLLDPKVQFQLVKTSNLSKIPDDFSNFSDVFLFHPSKQLKETIDKKMDRKQMTVRKAAGLWQVKISDEGSLTSKSRDTDI
jgi:uncharacterized membrane protein